MKLIHGERGEPYTDQSDQSDQYSLMVVGVASHTKP